VTVEEPKLSDEKDYMVDVVRAFLINGGTCNNSEQRERDKEWEQECNTHDCLA
jgi:hypothetical protein